jgi:hypothetical protein
VDSIIGVVKTSFFDHVSVGRGVHRRTGTKMKGSLHAVVFALVCAYAHAQSASCPTSITGIATCQTPYPGVAGACLELAFCIPGLNQPGTGNAGYCTGTNVNACDIGGKTWCCAAGEDAPTFVNGVCQCKNRAITTCDGAVAQSISFDRCCCTCMYARSHNVVCSALTRVCA